MLYIEVAPLRPQLHDIGESTCDQAVEEAGSEIGARLGLRRRGRIHTMVAERDRGLGHVPDHVVPDHLHPEGLFLDLAHAEQHIALLAAAGGPFRRIVPYLGATEDALLDLAGTREKGIDVGIRGVVPAGDVHRSGDLLHQPVGMAQCADDRLPELFLVTRHQPDVLFGAVDDVFDRLGQQRFVYHRTLLPGAGAAAQPAEQSEKSAPRFGSHCIHLRSPHRVDTAEPLVFTWSYSVWHLFRVLSFVRECDIYRGQ